jgi:general stress protein YciG
MTRQQKGGRELVAKHGREHMQMIGRRGWHALVWKRFGGDYRRAGLWLSRNGLRAQDPVPENGAWQRSIPIDVPPALPEHITALPF